MQSSGANENGNEEELEVATPLVMATPLTPFGNFPPAPQGKLQYKPLTIKIWFKSVDPAFGIRFVNHDDPTRFPHAYTINHPVPCSTSLWCPCLDGIWERSTWEISVSIPKSTDAVSRRQADHSTAVVFEEEQNLAHGKRNGPERVRHRNEAKEAIDMSVICAADFVEEKPHPQDSSRKIVSFAQGSPIGASHIGFAVGPFQELNLTEFREPEEDDLLGSSAVDVIIHCLPDQLEDAKNTCFPIYKAMDFFVKEFGSFPFSCYNMCFVQDMEVESAASAGMSIISDRLLYTGKAIEPIYPVTKALVVELASQWIGVNIVPRSWSDTWLILGLAHYISGLFLRKLMGNNDYRFRLKQEMIRITEEDIGKPPLSSRNLEVPIDPRQTAFIALKAPIVLHMLDQRLTRAGSNLGLGRVIPRIFLQALSGELPNGILSTEKFLRQCEKLAHVKLDDFAKQWIFGHGYPKFSVVQRFNKKKMVIEMGIRQQQFQDSNRSSLSEHTFVDEACRSLSQAPVGPVDAIFTGTLAIRIHEADGTPYEHIIELKDQYHKFDIPYNNKYRRRVRTRKAARVKGEGDLSILTTDDTEDDTNEVDQIHCLGDGFQAEADQALWELEEWSKEDEDKMSNESFEWIRLDAGFEWICTLQVGQPDYMYHSQLQQDRDVVAQFEAVQYFTNAKPTAVIAAILFRTIMDRRYYYGIRQMATKALARSANAELGWLGQRQLVGIFRNLYCFEAANGAIPHPNDFSDIANYLVRCSIVESLTLIRPKGHTARELRALISDQIRHNDNSENFYHDDEYVCLLINNLVESLIHTDDQHTPNLQRDFELRDDLEQAMVELERLQRMDRWRSSHQNLITRTIIHGKERLMQAGLLPTSFKELMDFTREEHYVLVRAQAFSSMLKLGALRTAGLAKYVLSILDLDPSSYLRHHLSIELEYGVGAMALRGSRTRYGTHADGDSMIIEEDTSAAVELRKDRESRMTIEGALAVLRLEFAENEVLKEYLWRAANDCRIAFLTRRNLLDICRVMYEVRETHVLRFKIPKMKTRLMCFNTGGGRMVIKKGRPMDVQKKAPIKPVKIKLKLFSSSVNKGG